MRSILVANPKGGSGKTTVATNLAGLFASRRFSVMLADMDRQQSAASWLSRRSQDLPQIPMWPTHGERRDPQAPRPDWVVVDSPAAVHGEKLANLVRKINLVLVPVSPSPFDMEATKHFLMELREQKPIRKGESQIAVVGNRVDQRTVATAELEAFLKTLELPILGYLNDTQLYVHCARDGHSLFDIAPWRAEREVAQWKPIARWLSRHIVETA